MLTPGRTNLEFQDYYVDVMYMLTGEAPAVPFERGRFSLALEPDGTGRAKLVLGGASGTLFGDAAIRADGTLAGTAHAKRGPRAAIA